METPYTQAVHSEAALSLPLVVVAMAPPLQLGGWGWLSLGTLAAWGWSTVVLLAGSDAHTYFEVGAVITTLILLLPMSKTLMALPPLYENVSSRDMCSLRCLPM